MTTSRSTQKRRGRPPSPELAERRRKELIEAAYHVFSERGYTAAGIADIAEKLDIGHGTFYRYFESKRDILDHVIDHVVGRIMQAVQADAVAHPPQTIEEFEQQLYDITDRLFELVDEEPGLVQVLALEATSIDEELTFRLLGLSDTFAALGAAYLQHGISEGFLRADLDTLIVARGIGALFVPAFFDAVRGRLGADERKRMTDGLIDFAIAGVRA